MCAMGNNILKTNEYKCNCTWHEAALRYEDFTLFYFVPINVTGSIQDLEFNIEKRRYLI